MTTFNPQQQKAIDALNQNVIVSASAGAGKTTVLIARLMKRILQDGVRIDEICAMTFTEAAASEMKIRLLAALNDAYTKEQSPFIAEQISLVETAQISTIHSFCLTIIKNYGYILGINPERATNILDDASVTMLKKRAIAQTMNVWLNERNDTVYRLLEIFSNNPIDFASLESALFTTATWLESKKNPKQALAQVNDNYGSTSFDAFPDLIQDAFFSMYQERTDDVKTLMQAIITLSDNTYDSSEKKHAKYFNQSEDFTQRLGRLIEIIKQIKNHDLSFYDELFDVCNVKIAPDANNEDYSALRKQITDALSLIVNHHAPLDERMIRLNNQREDVASLLAMTEDYLQAYQSLKIQANAFDFNDFESYALAILQANGGAIAQQMQGIYKEIMVDEFQDTNEYQDEIIRSISNGANIFRVGDVKQSIYRFRGAKPHIMQNLIINNEALNLYLSFNYRSKTDIVAYNNYVFDHLMNLTHGIQYTENDHVDVGIPQQSVDSHPVEFHIIERNDNYFKDNANQQKALYISQEIIRYHNKGYAFKDMVILVRSHAAKAYLKEAFEAANIPHYIDAQSGFYNSVVVDDVVSFFNYALHQHDYYLVHVLKSSFVRYSDDAIASLKLMNTGSLKEALKASDPELFALIHNMIYQWKHQDIITIMKQLINFNDTYRFHTSLQDKTNLDFLLEKAIQYQSQSTPSLLGFLTVIDSMKQQTSSEASPLSSDADVVTAMTIHQSKGLQFPIVFFWGTGGHTVMDHRDVSLTDDMLGVGLNHIELPYRTQEKNLLRDIIEFKQDNEEIEESLRLLYVALTRPQKHLVIVDVVKTFNPERLDLRYLRKHRRKAELLYAASPSNTILNRIDAMDLVFETLPESVSTQHDTVFEKYFSFEPQTIVPLKNVALNPNQFSKEGMAFGTILHEAVEHLPHRRWTETDLKDFDTPITSRLMAYNENAFTQTLFAYPTIEHEMPFTTYEGEGIIDFYAQDDSEIVIVDFKSDNASSEELLERYQDQLQGYINVLSNHFPEHNVSAYIYSFFNNVYLLIE